MTKPPPTPSRYNYGKCNGHTQSYIEQTSQLDVSRETKKVQLARLILKHLLKKNYTIEFSFTHTVRYIAASCVTVQNHPKLDPSTAAPILATTYSMKSNTIESAEAMTKDMAIVYILLLLIMCEC